MVSTINPAIQHQMPGSDGRSCHSCRYVSIPDLTKDRVWCPRTRIVMGVPEHGCCQYEREPGSDDEKRDEHQTRMGQPGCLRTDVML
jgi:hypothetical protein